MVYVTSESQNQVYVIDGLENKLVTKIDVGQIQLENVFFKPFRFIRYFLGKQKGAVKNGARKKRCYRSRPAQESPGYGPRLPRPSAWIRPA